MIWCTIWYSMIWYSAIWYTTISHNMHNVKHILQYNILHTYTHIYIYIHTYIHNIHIYAWDYPIPTNGHIEPWNYSLPEWHILPCGTQTRQWEITHDRRVYSIWIYGWLSQVIWHCLQLLGKHLKIHWWIALFPIQLTTNWGLMEQWVLGCLNMGI